jgi:hypothetical protein
MDAVDRFLEMWNKGDVDGLRPLMADGYSYSEPLYPGPYDADGHIQAMRDVLEGVPDRRFENAKRVPGAGSVAVTADWIGTPTGGSEMRLEGIFVFDLTPDGQQIERMRGYYGS